MERGSFEYLAMFRVRKQGNEEYKSIDMTPDQASGRRAYVRQVLKDTFWRNVSNDAIDNMRLWAIEGGGFYIEDSKLCEFYIPGKGISTQTAQFRRVRSMIPFDYMNLLLKDFDWKKYECDTLETQRIVKAFVIEFEKFRSNGMGLYIYSKTKGSGKTMLASIIINELSRHYPVSVKFISVLDLIELTKKSFSEDLEGLQALYDAGVLVLDDLGVQMKKEWIDTVLYRLIDHRYRSKLVTMYTSNIHFSDLKIDDRITDRINGTSHLIHLPEVPVRHRDKQQEKQEFLKKLI